MIEPGPEPATARLADLIFRLQELADYVVPFAIRAVCDLRLADQMTKGPRSAAELAAATGTHASTLYRTLRALACKGIFTETRPGWFGLTPLGQLLRTDHPLSHGEAYPLLPADIEAWAAFGYTMRTGDAAFSHVHGEAYYDWLARHPEDSRRFDGSVRSQNRLVLRGLLTAYDWAHCGTVIDVGGGDGTFLAGLLRRYRHLHGVVFDLPHVTASAPGVLHAADVADRCSVLAGSFFEAVPRGGDVYLLKTILHDWDDEHASTLLRTVRTAMSPGGRLLVMEALLRPGDAYNVGKLMDLHSLVLVQGRDRDRAAFQALLAGAGLRLTNVTETGTLAIMESVPS